MDTQDECKPVECSDDFSELLSVTFRVTFHVDADVRVVGLECLGPCPPKSASHKG